MIRKKCDRFPRTLIHHENPALMGALTHIRNKYGLNQGDIAKWTGVSRSLIAHYERFKRELPPAASKKYEELHTVMAKIETDRAKPDGQPHPESQPALQLAREKLAYKKKRGIHKVKVMKDKLLTVQKKYTQTRELLALLEMMMIGVTEEKNKSDFLWLRIQHHKAIETLWKCDEAVQMGMALKIAALEVVVHFNAGLELGEDS